MCDIMRSIPQASFLASDNHGTHRWMEKAGKTEMASKKHGQRWLQRRRKWRRQVLTVVCCHALKGQVIEWVSVL